MADILFSNVASSLLNTTITDSELSIELVSGFGANFPSPSGTQYFLVSLEDSSGNFEICKITSRSTDILTVAAGGRGYDNTTAQSFTQNVTRVELRAVAAVYDELVQVNGDLMTGDLDFNGNGIVDAVLSGSSTAITAGEIYAVPLRGATGVSSNEIAVPAGGGRATAGAAELLVVGDDLVQYLDVAGVIDLSSATIGVEINDGYLQVSNTAETEYVKLSADDAGDFDMAFTGITDLNITGANLNLGASVILQMNGEILDEPQIQDFSLTVNAVTAIAGTTTIDYELGSYVELAMDVTTSLIAITNPPDSGKLGTLRIRLKQGGAGTCLVTAWPTGTEWPYGGTTPTLSTAVGAIDFVDMWTTDGGTTWYAAFNSDWQ